MRGRPALALSILLLAGCLGPAPEGLEPAALPLPALTSLGPLQVERLLYDFGFMLVDDSEGPARHPTAIRGSVHFPGEGGGPFPVVVFMHGRHATCRLADTEETLILPGEALCPRAPPVAEPVDSFTGYDYLAEPLAGAGYVVVSVDANHINDRDTRFTGTFDAGARARAQLLLRTLDEFARLNGEPGEPVGDALVGRLDLGRIGLMGHSRGGGGVGHAIEYNAARPDGAPHAIRAVFALAPINFPSVRAPNVAYATLLPFCDGDVAWLNGAQAYDASRYLDEATPSPKHQLLLKGSNHNFYNTVWTWDDGAWQGGPCDPEDEASVRLGAEDQRRHGLALMAGFFRLYLGGEARLLPLFAGAAPLPAEACPRGEAPCDDVLLVSYQAPATHRLVVEDTLDGAALRGNDLGGSSQFRGFALAALCEPAGCPARPTLGAAPQLALAWDGPASFATEIPPPYGDVRRFDALTFRVLVDGGDARNPPGGQDLWVVLRDAAGREAAVRAADHGLPALRPPGGEWGPCEGDGLFVTVFRVVSQPFECGSRKHVLSMVRIPLAAFPGLDLASVRGLELRFDATPGGALQVTDLQFQVMAPP